MVSLSRGLFAATTAIVLTSSVGAWPGAAPTSVRGGVAMSAAAMRIGRSVGSPTTGHLIGGSHLDDAPYIRIVPTYAQGDVRWGLGPLVSMVDRAARQVRKQHHDAVLSVGHLSRPGGGEVDRHASHESGRDVDIAFYVKNHLGKPVLADHFVSFRGDGTAPTWPGATFDDERNWLLISALVTDSTRITNIFVAAPLRARLLAYASRIGAPSSIRTRAAEVMMQPRGALPHDDHFHVRIACPAGMRECVEFPAKKAAPAYSHVPLSHGRTRTGKEPAKVNPPPKEPTHARPSFEPPPAILGAPMDDADGDL